MCRKSRITGFIESANRHNAHDTHDAPDVPLCDGKLNMETNPHETAANPTSLPTCFVCKKPMAENQWFCRLTQKVNEAADPQATKILLCSPACALRHFTAPKTEQP